MASMQGELLKASGEVQLSGYRKVRKQVMPQRTACVPLSHQHYGKDSRIYRVQTYRGISRLSATGKATSEYEK